ncbi:MAG: hypothetical protein HETSPECPRED_006702 [Heterodermia speciosa]|uniref:Tyrosinase copper-binding domain-containing protein n=1 Tax=Heterodermia speciosa TaxID=116794 RepID=A0A8H3FNM0_9LECA|nr:MAG: hypothetical protein HETSPECPRED_006702 [Heterodermia speciosa]
MLSLLKKNFSYSSIEDDEYGSELKLDVTSPSRSSKFIIIKTGTLSLLLVAFLFLSSILSTWIVFFNSKAFSARQDIVSSPVPAASSLSCQQAPLRREWRTLTVVEQHDYVRAVRCLTTKPSRIGHNGTLYDDFPWVHKHTSTNTHKAAPFLPWHRYYLNLYETALKQECSFHGNLPYWDWSLDSSNFRASPVWDPSSGLGGDGTGPQSVGDGQCVTAGPFSDLEMSFYDGEYQPHCLSRGFPPSNELKALGELICPEAIKNLMKESTYEDFAPELERRAHTFLSRSVRGDLSRFTGPNDPIFFLHHVNIDRLWTQWQQIQPAERLSAYGGKANKDSDAVARMTDALDMGGLAPQSEKIQVIDVMDVKGGRFCYGY